MHDKGRGDYREMTNKEKAEIRYNLILRDSGMAKRERVTNYVPDDAKITNVIENIDKLMESGKNIYIWSTNTGNGKTTAACAILKAYARRVSEKDVYGMLPIAFWNFTELMTQMKEEIESSGGEAKAIKQSLKEADLVGIDDAGIKVLSDYDRTILYDIVNYRFKEMKPTIITSNTPPKDAERVFGKQIASRMVKGAINVEIAGGDRR